MRQTDDNSGYDCVDAHDSRMMKCCGNSCQHDVWRYGDTLRRNWRDSCTSELNCYWPAQWASIALLTGVCRLVVCRLSSVVVCNAACWRAGRPTGAWPVGRHQAGRVGGRAADTARWASRLRPGDTLFHQQVTDKRKNSSNSKKRAI